MRYIVDLDGTLCENIPNDGGDVYSVKPYLERIEKLNKLYRFQGSFWKGTKEQFRISDKAIQILCILIIPVAFFIYTDSFWLFSFNYKHQ